MEVRWRGEGEAAGGGYRGDGEGGGGLGRRAEVEAVGMGNASRAREGGAGSKPGGIDSDEERSSTVIGREEGVVGLAKERPTVVEGGGSRENPGEKNDDVRVGD